MSRGGAIFPATQGFYCDRTTEGTGLLPVKPQAEAFFTKHVLWRQKDMGTARAGGPILPPRVHTTGQPWARVRVQVQEGSAPSSTPHMIPDDL